MIWFTFYSSNSELKHLSSIFMEKINRFEKISLLALLLGAGIGALVFIYRAKHPQISFLPPGDTQVQTENLLAALNNIAGENIDQNTLFAYDEAAKYVNPVAEDYLAKQKGDMDSEEAEGVPGETPTSAVAGGQVYNVESTDDPSWGPAGSKVTVVLFSDFLCPYCAEFALEILPQLQTQYGQKVHFIFRDLPIESLHPFAPRVHEAGECAHAQDKFWPFHDLIYSHNAGLSETKLNSLAQQAGLDLTAFTACLQSGEKASEVSEDFQAGANAGVQVTPTLFVNNQKIEGVPTWSELQTIIEAALQ